MDRLIEIGFDGGMNKFIKDIKPSIIVPLTVSDRPNIKYIKEANKLRGWR
jgi:hypothetical protein